MSRGAGSFVAVAAVIAAGLIASAGSGGGGPMFVATTGQQESGAPAPAGAGAATGTGECAPGSTGLPAPGEPRQDSLTRKPLPIPSDMLALYEKAGKDYGLPWQALAGVGMIETNHGATKAASSAGAKGPMQFMPGTWQGFGVDGDGDGVKDILNPADAVPAAANYLKASGAPADWRKALFAYNRATWYVNDVLWYARHYGAQACQAVAGGGEATAGTGAPGAAPATGVGPQTAATRRAEAGLAATTLRGLRQGAAVWPEIKEWGGNGPRPNPSDHSTGHAIDGMIPRWNTKEGNEYGWRVARWYVQHAAELDVKYVIWDDQTWKARVGEWRPYTHPNGPTRNANLRHLNHVHVSFK